MDKERAKFILNSFRPDGADVGDQDFAEALMLATKDRELGEWLMKERAFDAEFAECLARVELPQGLRETVLLAMVQGSSDYPKLDQGNDRVMVDALATVKVPEGLRERVLESMERTKVIEMKPNLWARFGFPASAAAGIAAALFLFSESSENNNVAFASSNRVSLEAVEASFVGLYETPGFSLEQRGDDAVQLVTYLRGKKLPCGGMKFPPGLEEMKSLGCREIEVDGRKGSLICFGEKDGAVHLIIFRRDDVEGEFPSVEKPSISESGKWEKACWGNEKYVYTLITKKEGSQLREMF